MIEDINDSGWQYNIYRMLCRQTLCNNWLNEILVSEISSLDTDALMSSTEFDKYKSVLRFFFTYDKRLKYNR